MGNALTKLLASTLLLAGFALVLPGYAGTDEGRPETKSGAARGLQPMSGLMRDMAEEMRTMAKVMADGPVSAVERKRVAERMRRMTTLMERMSGLADEAALADAETQAKMFEMRREMDWMRRTRCGRQNRSASGRHPRRSRREHEMLVPASEEVGHVQRSELLEHAALCRVEMGRITGERWRMDKKRQPSSISVFLSASSNVEASGPSAVADDRSIPVARSTFALLWASVFAVSLAYGIVLPVLPFWVSAGVLLIGGVVALGTVRGTPPPT